MSASKDDAARFEKLGAFYLGRLHGGPEGAPPELLLYDSKDLTTHAVCVGMTGSGKTGLCVGLLEEAAIDGLPALAIDPKGDLGNLLLTFPGLRPADFEPWIDPGEATRKGMSIPDLAAATAKTWKEGLAGWGQDGARIARLRQAADFAIYTPGSDAGLPLGVLRSLAAPPPALVEDGDLFRDRVSSAVSGLLALLGVDADPVRSREHILLASILDRTWREGRDLDLPGLIRAIQEPPFDKVGVIDLESFFPAKDRFGLAMTVNNLLASPGFAAWMGGEPLDVGRLLYTAEGKPRVAILSIAHLSEPERMFFVTLLLNEVIGWMRSQSGTSSLRALLYMDEVFGYLPPTANPPSKKPLLTLLKQARAYGLGIVLATQNPVDLDYKALSNAGTWLLGRLQTERDKLRVLDGLEGASASAGATFDRQQMERTLAGLESRTFVMNNVHESAPVVFRTRWALSYLRGPLTRDQIGTLMADRKAAAGAAAPGASPAPGAAAAPARGPAARGAGASRAGATAPAPAAASGPPMVAAGVPQQFARVTRPASGGARLVYRPFLSGSADLHFVHRKSDLDAWHAATYECFLDDDTVADVWGHAETREEGAGDLEGAPQDGAAFSPLPAAAGREKSYASWEKSFKSFLYKEHTLTLRTCPALKLTAEPGETEAAFRIRVREAAREARDTEVEKLRKKYAPKLERLQDRIRTAETQVGRETSQYSQQKMQTAISLGATVLGALFGRKAASVGTVGRATTTMRGVGRAAREREDIQRAQRKLKDLHGKLAELEEDFAEATESLRDSVDPDALEIEEKAVRPRKTDIQVSRLSLVWRPYLVGSDGIATPA